VGSSFEKTVYAGKDTYVDHGAHFLKVHYDGLVETYKFQNEKRVLILGRKKSDCDIYVNSPIVSRKHLEINLDGANCSIKDLGGLNGTFVNRKKIDNVRVLKNGDNISIDNDDMDRESGVLIEYIKTFQNNLENTKTLNLEGKESIIIGRDKDCDIFLDHSKISRNHLKLTKVNGHWEVEDLKSTNGTFINGDKLEGKTILKNNDSIFVVNAKFTYRNNILNYTVLKNGVSIDAINISKVVKNKRIKKTLVDKVNLSINQGEFVAIVGGSGAGKSTLMDCINGFRPATSGTVLINGDDLYSNYGSYKEIMGYVPQKDIMYNNLTLYEMLYYSAQLRLPLDTSTKEIDERVKKVIHNVLLDGKENIKIKKLSGGQKKRVNIALELIAEPKLLFLDEPSSGLDPGSDKSIMDLLKELSVMGTTIMLITHSTDNLELCDKIIFLGYGGKLSYYGSPEKMVDFFEVKSVTDIFVKLSIVKDESKLTDIEIENKLIKEAEKYRYKLENEDIEYKTRVEELTKLDTDKKKSIKNNSVKKNKLWQLWILMKRYFKLIISDKTSLMIMLGQAPLVVLILNIVSDKDSFDTFGNATQVLFTITSMTSIMGILNSFLEIVKEREVLKREYSSNLGLIPYLLSKISLLSIICILQGLIISIGAKNIIDLPDKSLVFNNGIDFFITLSLALISSTAMGVLISAYAPTTERATFMMPLAIMPQLVFSGVLFTLTGASKVISHAVTNKWAMSGLGSLFDINSLQFGGNDEIYDHTMQNLLTSWGAMLIITVLCIALSGLVLYRNLKYE
jgi:ABC-type multidrug transport system ATPase subunit